MTDVESSLEAVRRLYRRSFHDDPAVVASAPGRVNLIGEHTDYNGGAVLPIAIRQRTYVAVGPARSGNGRAVSRDEPRAGEVDWLRARPTGEWWDYAAGVAHQLRGLRIDVPPFNIAVASDVPAGAGLASSAALEVATAVALLALSGRTLDASTIAMLAHRAESEFVGVACGIMDPFAVALARPGHALHLRCDTAVSEHVAFRDAVLIFDTGVRRDLRASAFNERRAECDTALTLLRRDDPSLPNLAAATSAQLEDARLPPRLQRRVRHVIEETARIAAAAHALQRSRPLPGELLLQSHDSLATLYECSTPELDWFAHHAPRHAGIRGARLTGAGWGGCAIAVGDAEALAAAAPALAKAYQAAFQRAPRCWITAAEAGSGLAF